MESVGKHLREARLRTGLGLENVSAETRINLKNLQAIEEDDVSLISSRFLYRSFVRQIAKAVNCDWTQIESAVAGMSEQIAAPLVPGQDGAPVPPSVPGLRPQRTHKLRWALTMASLMLMLGACSSFYGAWERARTDLRGSVTAMVKSFTAHAATTSMAKSAAVKTEVPAAPVATAPAAPASGFNIQLSAVENCWLSVVTDGKEVFTGVLQPSETKVLAGQDEARVRAGNAGGVEVSFNGRALGPLGRRGEVRTVVFTKNGYEVLQPEARARVASSLTPTPGGE